MSARVIAHVAISLGKVATIPLGLSPLFTVERDLIDSLFGYRLNRLKPTLIAIGLLVFTHARASQELMEKGGCIACHRVDEQLIGPAYKAVAAKYRSNKVAALEYLLTKVREGGEGVWGDIPMPPNSIEKIDDAELKTLLEWILGL